MAICERADTVAVWLIEHGANINAHNDPTTYPVFLKLVDDSQENAHDLATRVDLATLMIEHHANVNIRSTDGDTALHLAGVHMAQLLIDNGADVNARNNAGKTPLTAAKERQQDTVVELLKEHGGHE